MENKMGQEIQGTIKCVHFHLKNVSMHLIMKGVFSLL